MVRTVAVDLSKKKGRLNQRLSYYLSKKCEGGLENFVTI